ncbi:MAG: DUF5777 family beta-barrel protein [Polaribacter sp.]|nr:DUF5777 family beta-barrel protein [Polaribacter sp.]
MSLGIDIQISEHIFQLDMSNARLMNASGYLTKASGNWRTGDVYFGFNI